jgi:hypothetical protein
LLSKGIHKNKKTMRSMVVVFYLQDWNNGINERSELPPAKVEVKVKVKVKAENLLYVLRSTLTSHVSLW